MRWALLVFCAGEAVVLGLLAQALAAAIAGDPAGLQFRHVVMVLALALAGAAVVRCWPVWWRALRWRCTAVLPAPDGKGPVRIRLEGPDDARHEAVVGACWQAAGAAVVRLSPGKSGAPGAIFLPWQSPSADMARRLQRAALVALRVQPQTPIGERFC